MTSILVIGDPHFKVSNVLETDLMTTQIVQLARDKAVSAIVCLGDVLDRFETIHVSPLDRARSLLEQLTDLAPVFLLIGNHDRPNNAHFLTTDHPFNALKRWPNMTVVDTVQRVTVANHQFLLVPYLPTGRFFEGLAVCQQTVDGVTAVFTHQEFHGCQMGAIVSQSEDRWPADYPLAINGHIHEHNYVQPNLVNVGTPIQSNFGEADNKGVSIFTFADDKTWTEERHELVIPKKRKVRVKYDDLETTTLKGLGVDKIKVELVGTVGQLKNVMNHPTVKAWEEAGVKVVTSPVMEATTELKLDRASVPFVERLKSRVEEKNYPMMRSVFKELFGV